MAQPVSICIEVIGSDGLISSANATPAIVGRSWGRTDRCPRVSLRITKDPNQTCALASLQYPGECGGPLEWAITQARLSAEPEVEAIISFIPKRSKGEAKEPK